MSPPFTHPREPMLHLTNQLSWADHRSGWGYVLQALAPYHQPDGILFDGCLDATFGYQQAAHPTYYDRPWVGFLHHPIQICPWYEQANLAPEFVLNAPTFRQSLHHCKAIFTLSEHLASFVRAQTAHRVPVHRLWHPTEFTPDTFSWKRFNRRRPKLVQVGSWMRYLTTVFKLSTTRYDKYLTTNDITMGYLRREVQVLKNLNNEQLGSVQPLRHLSNAQYDALLNESVVFLDLYDSSANNAVVECMVRNTPLLVNRISPVVEYLGENYPLYYKELGEAEALLHDFERIRCAHEYLRYAVDKKRITAQFFVDSFFQSLTQSISVS
jgi:hypothetical protein